MMVNWDFTNEPVPCYFIKSFNCVSGGQDGSEQKLFFVKAIWDQLSNDDMVMLYVML